VVSPDLPLQGQIEPETVDQGLRPRLFLGAPSDQCRELVPRVPCSRTRVTSVPAESLAKAIFFPILVVGQIPFGMFADRACYGSPELPTRPDGECQISGDGL
jgi:hypothetical protein